MVNHAHFCSVVVSFQMGRKTPNKLMPVLAIMATNAMFPEIDFLPISACTRHANSGNSVTRILAVTGDM